MGHVSLGASSPPTSSCLSPTSPGNREAVNTLVLKLFLVSETWSIKKAPSKHVLLRAEHCFHASPVGTTGMSPVSQEKKGGRRKKSENEEKERKRVAPEQRKQFQTFYDSDKTQISVNEC